LISRIFLHLPILTTNKKRRKKDHIKRLKEDEDEDQKMLYYSVIYLNTLKLHRLRPAHALFHVEKKISELEKKLY